MSDVASTRVVISGVESAANSRRRLNAKLAAIRRDPTPMEKAEFMQLLGAIDPSRMVEQLPPERAIMQVETLTRRTLPRLTNRHFFQYKMDGKGGLAAFFRGSTNNSKSSNVAEMSDQSASSTHNGTYTMLFMEINGRMHSIDGMALPFRYNLPVVMQLELGLRKTLNSAEEAELDKPFASFVDHPYMEPDDGSAALDGKFKLVAGVFDLLFFPKTTQNTTRIVAGDVLATFNADERLKRLYWLLEASQTKDLRAEAAANEAEAALGGQEPPIELFLKMPHAAVNAVSAFKTIPIALQGVLLDGVVFAPDTPYVSGANRHLLKWKSDYTVDFVVKRTPNNKYRFCVKDEKRQLTVVSTRAAFGTTEEEIEATQRAMSEEFQRQAENKAPMVLECKPYIERPNEFYATIAEMQRQEKPFADILKRAADWLRWQPNGIVRDEKRAPNFIDVYWSNVEAIMNRVSIDEILTQLNN
jgi:hypothetical protein